MGMQNPEVGGELAKFSEVINDGERFYLEGVRLVTGINTDYGQGNMVVLKVRGQEKELGVWGSYLEKQAESVEPGDLNQWYVMVRRVVEGFSKRPVKVLDLAPAELASEADRPF